MSENNGQIMWISPATFESLSTSKAVKNEWRKLLKSFQFHFLVIERQNDKIAKFWQMVAKMLRIFRAKLFGRFYFSVPW